MTTQRQLRRRKAGRQARRLVPSLVSRNPTAFWFTAPLRPRGRVLVPIEKIQATLPLVIEDQRSKCLVPPMQVQMSVKQRLEELRARFPRLDRAGD